MAALDSGIEADSIAFSPDSRYLAAGEHGTGQIHIWDLPAKRVVRKLDTGTGWCFGVCFSPDGKVLGAASHRRSLFWHFDALV